MADIPTEFSARHEAPPPGPSVAGRRPLASRQVGAFRALAAVLARRGVSPNAISASSMVFAGLAGAALVATAHTGGVAQRLCWLGAVAGIQLRLLANLLDGLVAVEGGRGGPTGDLWNEAPDRIADAMIFAGAGFAAGADPLLGMGAALAAMFVAYVRALGASLGAGQIFVGPQAKPHRMALLTVCALLLALLPVVPDLPGGAPLPLLRLGLWAVIGGCALTALRRLGRIAQHLRGKGGR